MAAPVRDHLFLLCLSIYWLATGGRAATIDITNAHLNRSEFPNGFIFGSAGAAYQFEGAWNKGGKGPSVWDTFTHKYPEKIADRSNGDVATNSYNQYPEDVKLLQDMNMDAYRFSIAWPRILPTGSLSGGINKEGVQYYNKLINLVKSKGIDPFATLFHWDTPQGLEDKYGGFLSEKIAVDFRDFAEVCFKEFGDRVKHWITLNEPWSYANQAYAVGSQAPGRCSAWMNNSCTGGDSATEPYVVSHNLLLAHAAAARLYKDKYQASQKGVIGITLSSNWFIPFKAHSKDDIDAAQRSLDFMLGWYMDPLTHGDYPFIMRAVVGERLPRFTDAQSASIKGSFDFIGINYYTTYYAESLSLSSNLTASSTNDPHKNLQVVRGGKLLGPMAGSSWLFVYPPGIRKLLLYVKSRYNSPVIYITENGIDEVNNGTLPLEEALKDDHRIDYHYRHLLFLQKAIREGVDVRGYFAWSLLDNFEWGEGYTVRFGLNFVDFKNGLKRYPKKSALWFRSVLKK